MSALPTCSCALPTFPHHPNATPVSGALQPCTARACWAPTAACAPLLRVLGALRKLSCPPREPHALIFLLLRLMYLPGNIFRRLPYL